MTETKKTLVLPDYPPLEWPRIRSHSFLSYSFLSPSCEHSGDIQSVSVQLYISADLVWLKGHFPGQPVLPGVVQVHWAVELANVLFEISGAFRGVENLKFQSVVLPETDITLDMTYETKRSRVSFQYRDAEVLFSEGKIKYVE